MLHKEKTHIQYPNIYKLYVSQNEQIHDIHKIIRRGNINPIVSTVEQLLKCLKSSGCQHHDVRMSVHSVHMSMYSAITLDLFVSS